MLGISLRLPVETDLSTPLKSFIQSNYSTEELALVTQSISQTQSLRSRVVQSINQSVNQADQLATAQILSDYIQHLLALKQHFPFGPPVSQSMMRSINQTIKQTIGQTEKQTIISVAFSWYESFKHKQVVNDYDLNFELFSVIFDLAAVQSRRATSIKSQAIKQSVGGVAGASNNPISDAAKLFSIAAGIFEWLKEQMAQLVSSGMISQSINQSTDLSNDGLSFLSTLMLAQAQACFFERATQSNNQSNNQVPVSPSLIAKLAAGTAQLFNQCVNLINQSNNQSFKSVELSSDGYAWHSHSLNQAVCYQSASHYWQAKAMLAEDKYGLEIAHLKKAQSIIAQSINQTNNQSRLVSNLSENKTKLQQSINQRLALAIRDNESIYYDTVPNEQTFNPTIDPIVAVKIIPFSPLKPLEELNAQSNDQSINQSINDPYSVLMSPLIKQANDEYKLKYTDSVTPLITQSINQSNNARTHLANKGLPGVLDLVDCSTNGLLDETWSQVSEIQYKGGIDELDRLVDRLEACYQEAQSTNQSINQALIKESVDDSTMRNTWGTKWTRRASNQLTNQFDRDYQSINQLLDQGRKTDLKFKKEIQSNKQSINQLMLSRAELEAKIPKLANNQSINQSINNQSVSKSSVVRTLHGLLDQLSELIEQRDQSINQLKQSITQCDISRSLFEATHIDQSNNQTINQTIHSSIDQTIDQSIKEKVFNEQIALMMKPIEEQLSNQSNKQTELLRSIDQSMVEFDALSQAQNSLITQRQSVLQSINQSITQYNYYLSSLNEGISFYADLMNQRINPFNQRVRDFLIARSMEKQLICEQLAHQAAGYDSSIKQSNNQSNHQSGSASGYPVSAPQNNQANNSSTNPFENFNELSISGASSPTPPSNNQTMNWPSNPNLAFDKQQQSAYRFDQSNNQYNSSNHSSAQSSPSPAPNQQYQSASQPPIPSRASPSPAPHQPINNQSINQSNNHPVNPSYQQYQPNPSFNQYQQNPSAAAYQPYNQPSNQSFNQSNNQSMYQPSGQSDNTEREWSCSVCTLVNRPLALACDACGTQKGRQYA